MASLGISPQFAARWGGRVITQSLGTSRTVVRPLGQCLRSASTKATTWTGKATSTTETAAVAKTQIRTKTSTTVAASTSTSRARKTAETDTTEIKPKSTTAKKTTRASSTKSPAAKPVTPKKTTEPAGAVARFTSTSSTKPKVPNTDLRKETATITEHDQQGTRASDKAAGIQGKGLTSGDAGSAANKGPATAPRQAATTAPILEDSAPQSQERQPITRDSPQYKQAARRYTALMVALPIFLFTSYMLFDRVILGHKPQDLSKFRTPPPEDAEPSTAK